MLNEDLIDPKDVEIFRLKKKIESFKKYDSERKEYYKEALRRLGELESFVQELEGTEGGLVQKLRNKIENQRTEISRLKATIELRKLEEISTPEELTLVKAYQNKAAILKENKSLRNQLKSMKGTIDQLLSKLRKYETN